MLIRMRFRTAEPDNSVEFCPTSTESIMGCIHMQVSTSESTEHGPVYGNLLSNLPCVVYRRFNTPGYQMEYISEGCQELTGYTSAELTGSSPTVSFGDLIHSDDRQMVWNKVQAAIQNHLPYVLEYRITAKDGQIRWVWEKGRATLSGERKEVLDGLILDTTSRKATEERQRQALENLITSEARLDLLTELAPVGISITDSHDRVLYLNDRFTDLFGYTIADIPAFPRKLKRLYRKV